MQVCKNIKSNLSRSLNGDVIWARAVLSRISPPQSCNSATFAEIFCSVLLCVKHFTEQRYRFQRGVVFLDSDYTWPMFIKEVGV